MRDDNLVIFHFDQERDPEGRALRAFSDAHQAYEHLRAVRHVVRSGLLAASALVWAILVWPAAASLSARHVLLSIWATLFCVMLGVYGRERYWQDRFDHEIDSSLPERKTRSQ
jgi:hypothetical protein